jgi:hypothetical protein
MYEAAARRRPFDVGNDLETLNRIVAADFVPLQQVNPNISAAYAAITARAMAHDRDARYATAFDLAAELDVLSRAPSTAAATPTVMMHVALPKPPAQKRSRVWIFTAALIAVATALGVYLATSISHRAAAPPALTRSSISPHDADPSVADTARSVVEYVPPGTGKLFVYLGGVGSTPETGPSEVYDFATTLGYRVIALSFPREGERPDIATRLAKLVEYLARTSPTAGWDAYLDHDDVRWSRLAIGGFGQGAELAALVAEQHELARVVLFSAPTESADGGATPVDRWFAGARRRDPARYRDLAIPEAHIFEVSVVGGGNRQERAPGLRAKTTVDVWKQLLGDGR